MLHKNMERRAKVRNKRNIKKLTVLFVFFLMLLCIPFFLLGKGENKGNLIGFVYRADRTTPLEKGVVTIRNISTGAIYRSVESDNLGSFKIEGIEKGLYLVSINAKGRDYKVRNLIGVQAERISKVSFSLFSKRDSAKDTKVIRTVRIMASSEPIVLGTLGTTGDEQGDDQGDEQGDDQGDIEGDDPGDEQGDDQGDEQGDDQGDIEGDDNGDDQGDEQGDDDGDNDEDEDDPSPHNPKPPKPPNNPPPNNPGNVNN